MFRQMLRSKIHRATVTESCLDYEGSLSIYELHEKFTAGEVTATEIVRAYGLRIGQVESKVKAYITQAKDAAVAQAGALDASLKVWRKTSPMMGMPLAIKDNICTEGVL